jgi:hypothetical protein
LDSEPLIKSQGQRGLEPNINKKAQPFSTPLLFPRYWKMYVLTRWRYRASDNGTRRRLTRFDLIWRIVRFLTDQDFSISYRRSYEAATEEKNYHPINAFTLMLAKLEQWKTTPKTLSMCGCRRRL